MAELKPCPFCGGKAYIREYAHGHGGNGCFNASYECGCSNCKIAFKANSEFSLKNGYPVFSVNGYEKCVEAWNRRITEND